jgi:hypothetical protein
MTTSRGPQPELPTDASPRASSIGLKVRDDEGLIARRVRSTIKLLARSIVPVPRDQRRVVLIFGCQRSGTTMLQQTLLDRSWRVFILEEHDRRLVGDNPEPEETDWDEHRSVFRRIQRLPFEVVAVKPLVESYRATELLETATDARGMWMLRHYLDVARSNLRRFGLGNAHRDLEPFGSGDSMDWRCRGATDDTRATVIDLLQEGLAPLDAAALFWWTRNQLYFDQHLSQDERVRVLRYERVRSCPVDVVRSLSDYIGISLPLHSTVARVRTRPTGAHVGDLNPKVEELCGKLWESF